MAHIAGQRAADIFAGFEDVDPRSVLGSGDIKGEPVRLLAAAGPPLCRARGAVRISLGDATTGPDVELALAAFVNWYRHQGRLPKRP